MKIKKLKAVCRKSQYEARFKKWKLRKNLRKRKAEQDWKTVKWKVEKRKREGKETDVYVDDTLLPSKKVRKETSRYNISTIEALIFRGMNPSLEDFKDPRILTFAETSPIMPSGFSLRSPTISTANDVGSQTHVPESLTKFQALTQDYAGLCRSSPPPPFKTAQEFFLWPKLLELPYQRFRETLAENCKCILASFPEILLTYNSPPHTIYGHLVQPP